VSLCQIKKIFPNENPETAINETLSFIPIHHLTLENRHKFKLCGLVDYESLQNSFTG
jgi:hypothetical protein